MLLCVCCVPVTMKGTRSKQVAIVFQWPAFSEEDRDQSSNYSDIDNYERDKCSEDLSPHFVGSYFPKDRRAGEETRDGMPCIPWETYNTISFLP